jgi:hypothetical protein
MIQLERRALAIRSVIIERSRDPVARSARVGAKEQLAMGASIVVTVLVCAVVAGCATRLQGGLANAPTLGEGTPETRVHDAVANGRDSCERSAFPQGDVLPGRVPSCIAKENLAAAPAATATPAPGENWVSPSYTHGLCPRIGPGLVRTERSVATASVSASGDITCASPF